MRNTLSCPRDAERSESLRVLACASQGSGADDEARLRVLLSRCEAEFLPFSRAEKARSFVTCLRALWSGNHDLFVLEGTGIGAGVPAILGALCGKPFVLSSGDAVGPFLSAKFPLGSPVFHLYERLLYLCCSGFIGWTPYLVGRALTMGARRAMTCPGWAPYNNADRDLQAARKSIRAQLGIPDDSVVFGIAGSLTWSDRYQYCYGSELVRAVVRSRSNASVLIVGGGPGLDRLRAEAGSLLGKRIFLTGTVNRQEVPDYLAAMDVGSLPQSVDQVGGFRYTTKISEYRSVDLPFVTNENPVSYDLDRGDIFRLPGKSPWDAEFLAALSEVMNAMTLDGLATREFRGGHDAEFDRETQVGRVTAFLHDIAHQKAPQAARVGATA